MAPQPIITELIARDIYTFTTTIFPSPTVTVIGAVTTTITPSPTATVLVRDDAGADVVNVNGGDDTLSGGAIAGIVIGCIGRVFHHRKGLLLRRQVAAPQEQEQEPLATQSPWTPQPPPPPPPPLREPLQVEEYGEDGEDHQPRAHRG
ncbi:hypothetical protein MKZ38_002206 [Zalerion maritima]|uniref:Uncharacterized protein n=1 Tax=Zalerion maritima TaxID=339359 RepID=A0AAD5RPA9_9PEZI|nr:hypothetical protein MKZ38_002206 [Zalerion maritima]